MTAEPIRAPAAASAPLTPAHTQPVEGRVAGRTALEFAREERDGLVLAAGIRLAILAAILVWMLIDSPLSGMAKVYDLATIAVFGLLTVGHWWCARRRVLWPVSAYALFAVDCAFMGIVYAAGNPFLPFEDWTPFYLRSANFLWFYVFLMQAAFALTTRLVIWVGACIVAARVAQVAWVFASGDRYFESSLRPGDWQRWMMAAYDPNFVSMGDRITEVLFTASLTAGLAFIVHRSRRLVINRAATERARAGLARYFSPNVVDAMANNRQALERVRTADIAVMFVDIKGFTPLCESLEADAIAGLLRDYYRRLTAAVFAHDGTLDKFLGDGVMATFGTPEPRDDAPADALSCAFAVIETVGEWNAARAAAGEPHVAIGIGVHFGPAVIGNIGDARRLEFAVVGDTVNVASRVENLTRELGTELAVTEACMAAVRAMPEAAHLAARLRDCGEHVVRGRAGKVRLWCA